MRIVSSLENNRNSIYLQKILYTLKNHHRYIVRNVRSGAALGVTNCKILHGLYGELRKQEGLNESVSYATFYRRMKSGVFRDLGYTYEMVEIFSGVEPGKLSKILEG